MPMCLFLSPGHMKVLISIKIATPNPFIYSRKQWESNCRYKWLSGNAAQATKNWIHDQVAGFTWMPLEHIIPSVIWFKDTVFEPYKENTIRNPANNWRIHHGFMCMEQIQNIIQSSETPLSLWQYGKRVPSVTRYTLHHHTSNEATSHVLPDTWPNSSTSDPLMNTPKFSEKHFLRFSHGAELLLIEYKSCCCRKCL